MINYKITKKTKIHEINNSMAHNYYYLIQGRLYNKENTKYKKFKYVVWFDIFDVMEYFEKDIITDDDIKNFFDDICCHPLEIIKDYNDDPSIKAFYKFCNETIENYNKII